MTEKNATATQTVQDETTENAREKSTATAMNVRTETLTSEVYIFDRTGQFIGVEQDGQFVLEINDLGVVNGTHSKPSSHNVHGNLVSVAGVPNLLVRSADGVRAHTGALVNLGGTERYIGMRLILRAAAFLDQEEGVWVGTKVGP
jgi:hypothetical protein